MDTEFETLKNEVQRKIGRNVLLFQQVEGALKFLVAQGKFEFSFDDPAEMVALKQRYDTNIKTRTMGQVVGQFIENAYFETAKSENKQGQTKKMSFGFSWKTDCGDDYYQERKQMLASLVTERNELIHHFLEKWNLDLLDGWKSAEQHLDQQHEKILSEFEHLKELAMALDKGRKEMANLLTSDAYKRRFELETLWAKPLVTLLLKIAKNMARPDGWVILSTAAQLLKQNMPDEISFLKERYGHAKLKELMLATELFDITEEATNKGGFRVLYQIKPEIEVEIGEGHLALYMGDYCFKLS